MKPLLLALLIGAGSLRASASGESESSQFISEVIPIKHARATDVAAVLNQMITNSASASTAASNLTATLPPGTPTSPAGSSSSNPNGLSQGMQALLRKVAASGESPDLGQAQITVDERTNSLLVRATSRDMRIIKEIVSQLDHTLAQLLIEAAVIQVSLRDSESSSVGLFDGQMPEPYNDSFAPGTISKRGLHSITRLVPTVGTNSTPGQMSGFGHVARLASDLDVLVTSLATNSRVRILQRPRIQTSDGESASIFVGESRPYPTPTSTYYSGGAGSGYSSIQQLEVGITLEVTPYIKPDGFVELAIHQKIDQFAGNVTVANVGDVPITTSTEAQAKVTVRDRETILLGGPIETTRKRTSAGVPLLKDIPVLGALFRSSSPRTSRNELIVLIRPTLLPSHEAAALPAAATGTMQAETRH